MHFRIGTRSSKLALWQAYYIADLLQANGCTTELITYETKGDKQLDTSIAKIGSKGVFTEELETDLLNGTIDLAIHSAKDLQSTMPDGLTLLAFAERELAHDVVLSLNKDLDLNKPDLIVGSSSTRRRALLAKHYPNIRPIEARGNLQTRLQKLKDGQFEAMLLAYAGVHRMGFDPYIIHHLPIDQFIPPTGQGAIAVQASLTLTQPQQDTVRKACNHTPTELCLLAERAYLAELDGGCSVPVFAHATILGEDVSIRAGIISLDGADYLQEVKAAQVTGPEQAKTLGKSVADLIIKRGGKDILKAIRDNLAAGKS